MTATYGAPTLLPNAFKNPNFESVDGSPGGIVKDWTFDADDLSSWTILNYGTGTGEYNALSFRAGSVVPDTKLFLTTQIKNLTPGNRYTIIFDFFYTTGAASADYIKFSMDIGDLEPPQDINNASNKFAKPRYRGLKPGLKSQAWIASHPTHSLTFTVEVGRLSAGFPESGHLTNFRVSEEAL